MDARVWHDESERWERTGRLDQGPCWCAECVTAEETADNRLITLEGSPVDTPKTIVAEFEHIFPFDNRTLLSGPCVRCGAKMTRDAGMCRVELPLPASDDTAPPQQPHADD